MERRTWKTYALAGALLIASVIMWRMEGEALRAVFGEPAAIGVAWAAMVLILGWRLTND